MPGESNPQTPNRRLPTLEELMEDVEFPPSVVPPQIYAPGSVAAEAVIEGYKQELKNRKRPKGQIALRRTVRTEFDGLHSED